jgi:hypothetical protein
MGRIVVIDGSGRHRPFGLSCDARRQVAGYDRASEHDVVADREVLELAVPVWLTNPRRR